MNSRARLSVIVRGGSLDDGRLGSFAASDSGGISGTSRNNMLSRTRYA